MIYYRPIAMCDAARPAQALPLAGGWCWFDRVEAIARGGARRLIAAAELPGDVRQRLCAPRVPLAGLALDVPQVMGILNVTPDSFSDGGQYHSAGAALARGRDMLAQGAALLDIGGESTRPGAAEVPVAEEIARTASVIAALRAAGVMAPISIDTRKAAVAQAALGAGADLVNDVTGFGFDPAMAGVTAQAGAAACLMHSRGTPETMAGQTGYDDVLLDVYDFLEGQLALAEAAGIARARIVVDPGIGFAKTQDQNLILLRDIALFHGLGCGILLGASRKRFIGAIGGAQDPVRRVPGSVAVALAALAQGVQILRVHDVEETCQAIALWQAVTIGQKAGG